MPVEETVSANGCRPSDDGDCLAVVSFVGPLLGSLRERRWGILENNMLNMYTTSLKALNRKDDYVRTALLLVSKSAERRSLCSVRSTSLQDAQGNQGWLDDSGDPNSNLFHEVAEYAQQLPYELQLSLSQYFTPIDVDHHITLCPDKDGFSLTVELQPLVADTVRDAKLSLCLYGQEDTERSETWLECDKHVEIRHPSTRVSLTTNVSIHGLL